MSENTNNQSTPQSGPQNALIRPAGADKAGHLDASTFVAVVWRFEAVGARLEPMPFEVYANGRWIRGAAGDWVVMGANGELAVVAGANFTHLCAVQPRTGP